MSERSQKFIDQVWEARNNGADTEEKLVASILSLAAENIKSYTAKNNLQVLDKQDLLQLVEELNQ